MAQTGKLHKAVLDEPGSAGPVTLRRSAVFAALILVLAAVIMVAGRIRLTPEPQFTVFHTTFVFAVDLVTAFLIFGQFLYCRVLSYLFLAAAFFFSALVTIPFLLSFPGAIARDTSIIGGSQSAIWAWHLWHIIFTAMIGLSVAVYQYSSREPVERVVPAVLATVFGVILLVSAVSIGVTVFHDRLPVLYAAGENPLTPAFYGIGAIAAGVVVISLGLTVPQVRKRSVLHVWITMVLLALLAEVGASLSAYDRYTVGWYFGRIEGMLASSVLLVVLLGHVNRLYRNLVQMAENLSVANEKKDGLLAEVHRRQQEFEALVERSPDIIARVDRTRRLRYINLAIERLTGQPRESFRGKKLTELGLSPKESMLREGVLQKLFESGREQVLEHQLIRPEGTLYFHARLAPEFGADGRVESALVVERDITDLKQAQFALEQLTLQDPLTGIANRRYFEQFIDREWRLEARHRNTVAVIIADIDYFKAYNDHYGHQQGDLCLQQVAGTLQRHFRRPSDLLARYGGEEFTVVLLETRLSAAVQLAEASCRAISELRLPHETSPVAPVVTVSMGVAAAPAHLCTYPELFRLADQALYHAKRNGRNRVEADQPHVVSS